MPKKTRLRISSRQILVAVATALIISMGLFGWWRYSTWSEAQSVELSKARTQSLSDFFGSFGDQGLIPIVRPGAQEVGAVYNAATGRWIYEAATCFPGLKPKPAVGSALPNIVISRAENASIALGFDNVLSVLVGSNQVRSVRLAFSDVTVQDTPEHSLRETYSAQACPELQAILGSVSSGQPPASNVELLLVLGTIYRAKRTATIELNADAASSGALEAIKRVLPVRASVKSDSGSALSIVLENDIILPVAAAPAFIPTPTGLTLGPGQPNTRIVWMPFDPSLNPDAIETFKHLMKPNN
ncbi:hypothetical protein [Bradyrhizobium erythrophlei]|jgi:hypothetical protein|uniref:Uncharacterized protein n=1 Tax=Bradyrhizobium erythrophlei TaxID=1437360 RepID=A0A1M5KU48_9BRAD|nr:hypothetical protein [Bradyrhizobium erythrophlei]SHG56324.1 hypothetical protein SAMN05443248_1968 [Bradyrhizobium erythrophlei]